jgi:hypothetical protein
VRKCREHIVRLILSSCIIATPSACSRGIFVFDAARQSPADADVELIADASEVASDALPDEPPAAVHALSVAYQVDPGHTGNQPNVHTPLAGMGAGSGMLFVPTMQGLAAYGDPVL